ncbi:MAG: hypothetical protein ACK4GW_02065 [Pseudorhodobacter sp.]
MARKSAAELSAEADELSKLVQNVRKRPHSFALLIGKEGLVLEAHPTKSSDAMRQAAKKKGGGARGATGTMSIEGKTILFTCADDDPPRILPKMAKTHLRDRGLQFKVLMQLPDGSTVDGDAEDAEDADSDEGQDAPEAEAGDATGPASPDQGSAISEADGALQAEFDALADRIEAATQESGASNARRIEALAGMFRATLSTTPKKAAGVLKLLKTTLDEIAPGPDADPDEKTERVTRRLSGLAALEQGVDELLKEFS